MLAVSISDMGLVGAQQGVPELRGLVFSAERNWRPLKLEAELPPGLP